jgi:enamine deaminase RidA (YjgF/YER057c/UK114 family)
VTKYVYFQKEKYDCALREKRNRLGHVTVHSGIAYVTGQTPVDRSQDIRGQTAQVLARIDKLLEIAGTNKSKILVAQIWLRHVVQGFAA